MLLLAPRNAKLQIRKNSDSTKSSTRWGELYGDGDEAEGGSASGPSPDSMEGTTPIRIQTPLLHLSKREIVQLGLSLGVDYSITLSCYDPSPSGMACGHCDACHLRLRGFGEANVSDPATYAST